MISLIKKAQSNHFVQDSVTPIRRKIHFLFEKSGI